MAGKAGTNYREEALGILMEIMEEGKYSHIVINRTLNSLTGLDKQERSAISKICLGTIENCIAIDYELERYSKVKVRKMKPIMRNLLRMSVYQIIWLSGTADWAVCDEAVKIIKKRKLEGLSGFVNGVLRNIVRNKSDFLAVPENMADSQKLSIKYSMPEWIVLDIMDRYGRNKTIEVLEAFQEERPMTVRINLSRISKEALLKILDEENVKAEIHESLEDMLFLYNIDSLEKLKSFQDGYYQVQDISSALAARAAGIKPGDYIIDLCAAPGGKALHAADLLLRAEQAAAYGRISARDLSEGKVELMKRNFKRCRMTNIEACQADALQLSEADIHKADIVLADLPCSGLGIIGRKPDIKYKMTKEKQAELSVLQREILKNAAQYVKPGGVLIYSTCTINREENEDNFRFIIEELGFEAAPLEAYIPEMAELGTIDKGYVQLLPKAGGTDGFFISKAIKA